MNKSIAEKIMYANMIDKTVPTYKFQLIFLERWCFTFIDKINIYSHTHTHTHKIFKQK